MKIYIELLGEGTPVWRPVEAVHIQDDLYRITQANAQPEDERWSFERNSVVRCKFNKTQDRDLILVAQEPAKNESQKLTLRGVVTRMGRLSRGGISA